LKKGDQLNGQLNITPFLKLRVNIFNFLVLSGSYYVKRNYILSENDYISILGMSPQEHWIKLNPKEKAITNYILLNCVNVNNIITHALTEQNYISSLKVIKIPVHPILEYQMINRKGGKIEVISIEWLHYTDYNNFIRILIFYPLQSVTLSKIYTGKISNKILKNIEKNYLFKFKEDEDMLRELDKLSMNLDFFTKEKRKVFKQFFNRIIDRDFYTTNFVAYDSLSNILEELILL
jgi:hypothetical protein